MGKVRYGLDEVHYSLLTESQGSYTWATPVALPGAVSLTLDISGEESPFYADNTKYFSDVANGGYTGTLTLAYLDNLVKKALLDYATVTTGTSPSQVIDYVEKANPSPAAFALMFRIRGNEEDMGYVFYNCKLSRAGLSAETIGETTDPQSVELPITISSIENASNDVLLARVHKLTAGDTWFSTAPTLPTLDA